MASTSGTSTPYPTSSEPGVTGSSTANGSMSSSTPPVVDRMAETAHRVVDQLASKAGPAYERVRTGMSSAKDTMGRTMDGLHHSRDEWVESARESVRQHPLTAIGVAAAVGYVLARLTSSR